MSFALRVSLCLLALSLNFINPALAQSQSASSTLETRHSADETALRALAEAFFHAWAAKELDGFLRLWSDKSAELEARRKSAQELFAGSEKIELRNLTIRAVKVEGANARVRVETDARVTEAGTGKEKAGYGKTLRTLECVKESGRWKVRAEASTYDEIGAALAAAKSDQERAALLAEEKELATAELARALVNQGARLYSQGEHTQATAFLRLAQSVAEKIGARTEIARATHNLGNVHLSQGDYAQALERYRQGMAMYEALDDKAGIASMLNNIGNVHRLQGDYTQALDYFQKCMAIRETLGNRAGIATALNNIGIVHDSQGDRAQALEYYQRSLKISEEIRDEVGIARTLNNLGLVEHHLGDYARALEYFQRSLLMAESLGDKTGIPGRLLNIGIVHDDQGSYAQALEYYQKSLALYESFGDKSGIAKALSSIGNVHNDQGAYPQALEHYQKSLALRESMGDKDGIADAIFNIGIIHSRQGDYAQALERFQKSLAIYEALGTKASLAGALKSIGKTYGLQENYVKSLEYAQRAATVARSIGASETLWESLTFVHRAYRQLNRPVEARQALEESITIIETLRYQVAGGVEAQQSFFQSKVSPYHAMVGLLVREGRPTDALTFAEHAKARVLLDVLKTGRVNSAKVMTGQEQEQESKLRSELVSLNTQATRAGQQESPDQAGLDELKSLRDKARLKYEAFQTSLYAAHPELRAQRGDAPAVKGDEIAALLPNAGSALLEYLVTDEMTYLFAITKSAGAQVYALPIKRDELIKQTESFRRQLAGRDLGFRASARGLYQLLLKPAEAQLRGKTNLIISPDDKLWDLPFQALLTQAGRYVIESSAVYYVPSLTVLREMKAQRGKHRPGRQAEPAGPALLALGNPALGKETVERAALTLRDEKLDPLPEAEQEVKALRRLYGTSRSKVYIGADAREDRVKIEAGHAGILHFATHGTMNNASPMYSHLVLAQGDKNEDGLLEAWELMQLDLRADLAVLSACETARGRFGAGEGMIGLSWALFVAGVPATVVSQWKVESASTRELMLAFHRQLIMSSTPAKPNTTKAEALRQAALKLMKSPQTSHPFYWAGFVLVGDGR
jgi:CHAT domain-containing protein/tetratricopeptide (TPR) repeat protein